MKNLTSLLAVLCISFATTAKDWRYNRLDRLYKSNQTRCLKISKRYIKYLPDSPEAYYFASIVYRNKSKKHLEMKTRYMMMSKSIGYAMKFEDFEDLDLETKVNWEAYLEELRLDTDALIQEMEVTHLANFGERLAIKHEKMVENRQDVILIASGPDGPPVMPSVGGGSNSDENNVASNDSVNQSAPTIEEGKGYFGIPSGKEVAPSFNKIQESQLLELINEERRALFMQPLKLEHSLIRAARYHAYDMASQNYFLKDSYDRKNGQLVLVTDELTRAGQFHAKKHIHAQNIAAGGTSAIETFDQWMEYDEQYDVLFDEASKKVGIGIYYDPESEFGYYWVLVTAKK